MSKIRSVVYEVWVNAQPHDDPIPDKPKAMANAERLAKRKRIVQVVQLVLDENGKQVKAPVSVAFWENGERK